MKIYKTTKALLMAFILGASLTSCSNFLDEEDKDLVIPETVTQYEAMLHKEAFLEVSWFYMSDLMTDDITENPLATTSAKNTYKSLYTWKRDVERDGEGQVITATNSMWQNLYSDILVANYIIENGMKATGTAEQRNQLVAEAYFVRGRAYLELVNIYAPVYDAATAANTPGVPLRLDTGVSNDYTRASVAEVYNRIEADLKEAIKLFAQTSVKKSLWHPNADAAQLLLSRAYLYKGEWQKVVDATEQLAQRPLYDLTRRPNAPMIVETNTEVLHSYGSPASLYPGTDESLGIMDIPSIYQTNLTTCTYGASEDLLSRFALATNDCRKYTWVINPQGGTSITVPAKWHGQFTQVGAYTYRLAEAYLNRAEAMAALSKTNEAQTLMTKYLTTRIANFSAQRATYMPASTDPLEWRKFIVDQRRLEFCFEDMRWFDLRRINAWYPHTLSHTFTLASTASGSTNVTVQGTEHYTLNPSSPNYVFEIPESETQINTTISAYGKREEIINE
ncbi:MAG: RagB/SusD family nutrient uptake outer membrane protein [Bacteroidales bacterium]|nr:RagB/SusD family nutrient uptake outer membrane protein [Bacteroidales bacterium]